MGGADGMSAKFMKNAFVGWTFTAGLYYPPDFDASKLTPLKMLRPKGQKGAQQTMNIRMMFPFTMVCDQCKEYNYTGTKFTAKVEQIKHETYLGLKVYRFYGRCRHCWSEFTFKTDPKNSDYTMESGGKRTYEAWKDADLMESMIKAEKEKEAAEDAMKALEQKAVDVHAEMERLEDLDAIRTLNRRLGSREQTIEEALEFVFQRQKADEESMAEVDQREIAAFQKAQEEQRAKPVEGEEADPATSASSSTSSTTLSAAILSAVAERASSQKKAGVGARFSVKRKASELEGEASASGATATGSSGSAPSSSAAAAPPAAAPTGLGLGAYDSDDSS